MNYVFKGKVILLHLRFLQISFAPKFKIIIITDYVSIIHMTKALCMNCKILPETNNNISKRQLTNLCHVIILYGANTRTCDC